MTATTVRLAWGAATDRGLRRAANEDAYLAQSPLFLVADGMGGHEGGAAASQAALAAFDALIGTERAAVTEVEAAVREAARAVHRLPAGAAAPGTTLSGAVVCTQHGKDYWLILNIGDSRTYRWAGGALTQISIDHSAVQELVDSGALDPADAAGHPHGNVVTRAVGAGSEGTPDYWLLPIDDGDRILVCSDGLTKELHEADIVTVLAEEPSPQAAATRLVHTALLGGGRDNVTVVVVDAHGGGLEDDDEPTAPRADTPPAGGAEWGFANSADEDTHPAGAPGTGEPAVEEENDADVFPW